MDENQNQKTKKQEEKEAKEKVGETVTRAGLDYATEGKWENFRNKPVIGRVAQHTERKGGKKFARSPGGKMVGKQAKQLNDSGVVDLANKSMDTLGGANSASSSKTTSNNNSVQNTSSSSNFNQNSNNTNIGKNTSNSLESSTNDAKTTEESSNKNTSDSKEKGSVKGILGKKNLKTKILLASVISSLVSTMLFIVVLISPLIALGIIDIDGGSSGGGSMSYNGYSNISSNSSYWWPIGGNETNEVDGKIYASGAPACTNITSNFGLRELDGRSNNHSGMDISCGNQSGQDNIIAALDGTVIEVVNGYSDDRNQNAGYGNHVKIQHNNGDVTIYGHMYLNSITVEVGDHVSQGQVIGKMGSSGNSTGTHLHFEIRRNGTPTDPANYISSSDARPSSTTGNYVSASTNKQSICLSLKASGISENGTIAVMTNINHESSFSTTALGDGGTSFGICQWHNERYTNLQNSFPNSYQTVGGQIQFLIYELQNGYSSLYNNLVSGSSSPSDLTYEFCSKFEVPANTENTCRTRGNNASNFTDYVKNNCK